jgi:hypothetical protein
MISNRFIFFFLFLSILSYISIGIEVEQNENYGQIDGNKNMYPSAQDGLRNFEQQQNPFLNRRNEGDDYRGRLKSFPSSTSSNSHRSRSSSSSSSESKSCEQGDHEHFFATEKILTISVSNCCGNCRIQSLFESRCYTCLGLSIPKIHEFEMISSGCSAFRAHCPPTTDYYFVNPSGDITTANISTPIVIECGIDNQWYQWDGTPPGAINQLYCGLE